MRKNHFHCSLQMILPRLFWEGLDKLYTFWMSPCFLKMTSFFVLKLEAQIILKSIRRTAEGTGDHRGSSFHTKCPVILVFNMSRMYLGMLVKRLLYQIGYFVLK